MIAAAGNEGMRWRCDLLIAQVTRGQGPPGEGECRCQSEEEDMGEGFHDDWSTGCALTSGLWMRMLLCLFCNGEVFIQVAKATATYECLTTCN
jgi:hypothetical protein